MSPPAWAPPVALIYATFGTLLGVYAFIAPLSAARQHGLEIYTPETPHVPLQQPQTEFIHIFGGRNIAVGLMVYALYYQGQYSAVGTVLLCLMFSGTVDAIVTRISERGTRRGPWVHLAGVVGLGVVGWGIKL